MDASSDAARVISLSAHTRADRPPHTGGPGDVVPFDPGPRAVSPGWERRAADVVTFLRRRAAGAYDVDEYGFDADLTDSVLVPLLWPLYERWLRVDVGGVEHLPLRGERCSSLITPAASGRWTR